MQHDVETTRRFEKDRKRCEKRGCDLRELDKVIEILRTRNFTPEEVVRYKPHYIIKQDVNELHLGGRKSNWVLTYKIDNGVLYLERTGTHDDCMLNTDIPDDLIWL